MATTKSFVPQFVRKLHLLALYAQKHKNRMNQFTLTSQQQADINTIISMDADWTGIVTHETP